MAQEFGGKNSTTGLCIARTSSSRFSDLNPRGSFSLTPFFLDSTDPTTPDTRLKSWQDGHSSFDRDEAHMPPARKKRVYKGPRRKKPKAENRCHYAIRKNAICLLEHEEGSIYCEKHGLMVKEQGPSKYETTTKLTATKGAVKTDDTAKGAVKTDDTAKGAVKTDDENSGAKTATKSGEKKTPKKRGRPRNNQKGTKTNLPPQDESIMVEQSLKEGRGTNIALKLFPDDPLVVTDSWHCGKCNETHSVESRNALDPFKTKHGFRWLKIEEDGDCFYNCVWKCLVGDSDYLAEIGENGQEVRYCSNKLLISGPHPNTFLSLMLISLLHSVAASQTS